MSVTVIGDAFVDVIVPVQSIKPGETHHRKIITLCGGAANVAVQVSKLGEKSKFIGKVGNDVFGKYFRQNLVTNGVKDLIFVDDENPTGLCISMIYDNGERTLIANRGTNDYFGKEEVKSCVDEIINSRIVYFSGYSLLTRGNSESMLYAIEECRKQNCEIYFNPGAPNLIKEDFKRIIHDFVDVLILNIEEAKNIIREDKIEDILKSLTNIVELVVITMGKSGCILSKEGKHVHIETEKLDALDTTGAGDAFSAGFIVGKLKEKEEEESARLGNEVAARFLKEKMELMR